MTSIDEESDLVSTTDTRAVTVRLPRALIERLEALTGRTTWDMSRYVSEALAGYLPVHERELALIDEAIAELDAGGRTCSNEEVMAWVESWGTPNELPPPE